MKKLAYIFMIVLSMSTLLNSCREKKTSEKIEDGIEGAADDVGDAFDDAADAVDDAVD